jgi:hypothetical protein
MCRTKVVFAMLPKQQRTLSETTVTVLPIYCRKQVQILGLFINLFKRIWRSHILIKNAPKIKEGVCNLGSRHFSLYTEWYEYHC